MRVLMISNAAAGGTHEDARAAALAALREYADAVEVVVEDPAELPAVLDAYPDRQPVVAGGDGALHRLVAVLAERGELTHRTVGLVPLGTGNDLARTLGIPLDPAAAARVVGGGVPRRMDLLVDDAGGIVVNAVHLGIGAAGSRAAAPLKPLLGRLAYRVGGLAAGFGTTGWRLRVEVDGRPVAEGRRRVLMVAIGNGSSVGGGTPLTPDARPDDARADVVVSFATGPLERIRYAALLRRGEHTSHDEVTTVRGAEITVAGQPVPVSADGELYPPITRRTWRLRPGSWQITAPAR